MNENYPSTVIKAAQKIKLILLDVDGVLTDGRLYYGNDGEELKAFDIQDGLGIKLLQKGGIDVGIITGRTSKLLTRRTEELDIELVVQGREDKLNALNEILEGRAIDLEEIAQQKKLSVDEVIRLHTQPKYLIYFLGFQPGFMYLGGLDERIHTPRRPTPRL